MVSQGTGLVAVQGHPTPAITSTDPVPAVDATVCAVADTA
jgi:hypothetical protein